MPYEGQSATNPQTGDRVAWRGGRWVPVPKAYMAPSPDEAKKRGQMTAASDIKKLESADQLARDAYTNETTARTAEETLKTAPVGPLSGITEAVGSVAPALGVIPGFPDEKQTASLQNLGRLQGQGALADAPNLKGPLSDRDLAMLRGMQYDPRKPKAYNNLVNEYQKWTARRQAAYGAALRSWDRTLGSPSASNANGQTFEQWWGKYSSERLPPPGVKPVASAPANPAPKRAADPTKALSDDDLRRELGL